MNVLAAPAAQAAQAAQPLAKSGEALKAGPIGLAVILLLCIACYFLFKSMSKHLRTVREQFPEEPASVNRPSVNGPARPLSRAEFTRAQASQTARAQIIPPSERVALEKPTPIDESALPDVPTDESVPTDGTEPPALGDTDPSRADG